MDQLNLPQFVPSPQSISLWILAAARYLIRLQIDNEIEWLKTANQISLTYFYPYFTAVTQKRRIESPPPPLILSGLNDRWSCRLLESKDLIVVLNKDTSVWIFVAHSLCPSLAGGCFHEAMEVLLHITWLPVVFTWAQHPPLSSWMGAAVSESLWYRTQQGSDSITLSKQTANMSPACYHFSLIVMSEPL